VDPLSLLLINNDQIGFIRIWMNQVKSNIIYE